MANMVVSDPKDGITLLEKLEFEKLKKRIPAYVPTDSPEALFEAIHRIFHYETCVWLKDQGYETIK